MKFYSIITVVKNGENYIEDTINSVLSQTYKNFEYIIIDGYSKDKTFKICQSYKDKRIKLFRSKDNNFYEGLNLGISLSKSSFVGILNCGDLYFDTKVLLKTKMYLKNNNKIICSNLVYFNNQNKIMRIWKKKFNNINLKNSHLIAHPTLFIDTNILKKNIYKIKYSISSDTECILRLIKLKYKIIYKNYFSVAMKTGGLSTNPRFFLQKLKQDLSIYYTYFGFKAFTFYLIKIFSKILDYDFRGKKIR